jgi:ATP-dependent RNA helicase DDX27
MNFVTPTPVQAATIPVALLGRDVCGCAATGTGKTAAFMLPVLERLLFKPSSAALTRVLVLVPTRELGVQVFQVSKQLAQFTRIQIGLAVGGLDMKMQETSLRANPDIVIATPGRLIDHIHNTPSFNLEDIEVLILDEADRSVDDFSRNRTRRMNAQHLFDSFQNVGRTFRRATEGNCGKV